VSLSNITSHHIASLTLLLPCAADVHADTADIWLARSARNLSTPAKTSPMYSPIASFHGIRSRTPHMRAYTSGG
jgi:hypothetical protein